MLPLAMSIKKFYCKLDDIICVFRILPLVLMHYVSLESLRELTDLLSAVSLGSLKIISVAIGILIEE